MILIRHVLICSGLFNLVAFSIGLFLGVFREDLLLISFVLTVTGLLGMILFAITWLVRPKALRRPLYIVKHLKHEKEAKIATINPDTTEAVMKNIRGIPYLIQAIQYSMEASYYRDMETEMGEGIVRTSVIHTAPACTSVLDSDHEDEPEPAPPTPRAESKCFRHSAEEQWLPFGESWRNEQLRLSLERGSSNLLVFPYSESSPHRDSMNKERIEHEFSRIDSIKRPHGYSSTRQLGAHNQFQVRCIGMSASFIERFNHSFRASSFDQ